MDKSAQVQLRHIQLKHFRCFSNFNIAIDKPYVLFEGANGTGKTSLLEALYYSCFLRSFRTHSTKELISFGQDQFFIKVELEAGDQLSHAIQIGFSHNKRIVKVDQKAISSYKDLMSHYRVVSITESDLDLIQASPQHRRLFMDQLAVLLEPSHAIILRDYRQMVDQRNALLARRPLDTQTYQVLTKQLWKQAHLVQKQRQSLMKKIAVRANKLAQHFIDKSGSIKLAYHSKRILQSTYDEFIAAQPHLQEQEIRFGRSLFGAHLDDLRIEYKGKHSRQFASRGQQKLVLILLKMAQLELLAQKGIPGICLIDDFMTDFDEKRASALIDSLQMLGTQLIFTSPIIGGQLADKITKIGGQTINISD